MRFVAFGLVVLLVFGAGLARAQETDESSDADAQPNEATEGAETESPPEPNGSTEAESADESPFKSESEKISYAIGVSIGRGLKRDGAAVDAEIVGRGLAAGFDSGDVQMTDAQIRETIIAFQRKLRAKLSISADGRKFVDENKEKEGVVVLPSGLHYRVITEGDGAKPKQTDTVKAHYKGTLIDGTEFDSSYERDEPTEFQVTGVIPGWTEALQLMPVGSKWELVIPPELGYGISPPPGSEIKPGDVLVFEIELVEINEEG